MTVEKMKCSKYVVCIDGKVAVNLLLCETKKIINMKKSSCYLGRITSEDLVNVLVLLGQ